MSESRTAYLCMLRAHNEAHKGVPDTLSRMRSHGVWIHNARELARSVSTKCPKCILDKKRSVSQQIGILPSNETFFSPVWNKVNIDMAGPFTITKSVRDKSKVWLVIYVCRATRAVCILVCCGYGLHDFKIAHQFF